MLAQLHGQLYFFPILSLVSSPLRSTSLESFISSRYLEDRDFRGGCLRFWLLDFVSSLSLSLGILFLICSLRLVMSVAAMIGACNEFKGRMIPSFLQMKG